MSKLSEREEDKKKKKKNEEKKVSNVKVCDEYLHQQAPSKLMN